jgi:phage tail sheath protein FI
MPEYLSPGVYVEETSFRAKSIEGVSTTTTGFIGPTRFGPIDIEPELITSLVEFERMFGDRQKLEFSDAPGVDNYVWHAVRAFFEEGGKRLYVSRTFRPMPLPTSSARWAHHAAGTVGGSPPVFRVFTRFPGRFNPRVTFTFKAGQNVLVSDGGLSALRGVFDRDVVWVHDASPTLSPPLLRSGYYNLLWDAEHQTWRFAAAGQSLSTAVGELQANLNPGSGQEVRVITVTVTVEPSTDGLSTFVASDLPVDPSHLRAGSPDSLFAYFAEAPASLTQARSVPIVLTGLLTAAAGVEILESLFAASGLQSALEDLKSSPDRRSIVVSLTGGDDGERPTENEYEGIDDPDNSTRNGHSTKTGLKQFEDIEDISIVAAPGSTFGLNNGYSDQARAITGLLITHATLMRYRIAVLDCGDGQSLSEVRAFRAQYDSTYAALYYPWVRILDPLSQQEINVPPSGFVAGIYCRNDINRAVYKAPANEVVNLALGFETFLNKSQQDVLNPEGINCFRFFEGRGMRLWGARTISSDPEWKYVNLRRYFAYLERSIDRGTQWAVFEPNGELLWTNVQHTIEDFLLNEWHNGALLGDRPEKAFFVKCDRSTMSQNDLDNGRLVCLVGVAPLRPAEFVIFRIGQWTGDRKI